LSGPRFKDISEISALSNIQSINLIDTNVVSIDSFKNLSKINSLVIHGTETLQSMEGVGEMTKLTNLDLSGNGIVVVDELDQLINLETLYLNDNDIIEFPSITQLNNLTVLDVSDNDIIALGENLSGLSSLTTLNASNNNICDLSTLDDLRALVKLDLSYNNLGCDGSGESPDFSSLQNAVNLNELYLDHNDLVSISGLQGLDISLTELYINDNLLTDITPIAAYTNITDLVLYNNNISNINDLSGMTGLTSIDLSDNNISNFSDLLLIPGLTEVDLSNNSIIEIPDISSSWPDLVKLDLNTNIGIDTSLLVNGHANLQKLVLYNCGLTELSGISDLPLLDELVIFDEELEDEIDPLEATPNNISIIRDSFNNTPELVLYDEENIFDFGFELGPNVQIINSIQGLLNVTTINFADMDIDVIDEDSIQLPNLSVIRIFDNNITNLDFILGNPKINQIYLQNNQLTDIDVFNGTDITDLDQLTRVEISSNNGDIVVNDTFKDIPNLRVIIIDESSILSITDSFTNLDSLVSIAMTNTNVIDIDTSFTNLDLLDSIVISTTGVQTITSSFSDLPVASAITIDSSSIVSIDNSINRLPTLASLVMSSSSLETITSSFNNIFDEVGTSRIIHFDEGEIGTITDSFNNGNYLGIEITNQLTSIVNSSITGSFNGNTITGSGILIHNSEFKTVDDCFNDFTVDYVVLTDSGVETITNVFDNTTINNTLSLASNRITEVPSLNTLTSVDTVDLSDNDLTTLAFIDNVIGLTTLNLTNQINEDTSQFTLSVLDGINNLPNLVNLEIEQTGITSIDGLEDVGLTSFDYAYGVNNGGTVITSITGNSFNNSLIENLQLQGHQIENIGFLSNFSSLESLYIGVDLANLSTFAGLPLETSLTQLVIDSKQAVSDFGYFNDYNLVTAFTLNSDTITTISNLDGMDALTTLSLPLDQITAITNSFNNLTLYNPLPSIMDSYTALTTITNSFDIFGLPGHHNSISLQGNINIDNSFNNVEVVSITDNLGLFTPKFNALSFDSVTDISFEYGDFNSYSFLDIYASLTTLEIGNLTENITDLSNTNITEVVINTSDLTVDSLTLVIADNSKLEYSSSAGASSLLIDAPINDLSLDATLVDVTLVNTRPDVNIEGTSGDLVINNNTLTTLTFDDFEAIDMTLNTNSLANVINIVDGTSNAVNAILNNTVATMNIELNVSSLQVNNNTATNYTIDVTLGNTVLNNTQADITVDYVGNELNVDYNTLQSIQVTGGNFNSLNTDSLNIDTVDLSTVNVTNINVTSDQAIIDINSSTAQNVNVTNNSITTLNSDTPSADITLLSTNPAALHANVKGGTFVIDNDSVSSITIDDLAVINTINMNSANGINSVSYGTASVTSVNMNTFESSLSIIGTDVATFSITGGNLNSIIFQTPGSDYSLNTNQAVLTADIIGNEIDINGDALVTMNIDNASDISTLDVTAMPVFKNITTTTADIDILNVNSANNSLNIDAVNSISNNISGNNLTSLVLNLGTHNSVIDSTNSAGLSLEVVATNVDLTSSSSIVSDDNSTTLSVLTLETANLTNIITGTAAITTLDIDNSSTTVDITGTNITNLDVDGNIADLDINTTSTSVDVNTTSVTGIVMTTDTDTLTITSAGNATVTSSTLDTIEANLSGKDLDLTVNKVALNLSVTGTVNEATITGSDVDGLTLTGATIDTLHIENTDIATMDVSSGNISNLFVVTTLPAFTATGNDLEIIDVLGSNLTTFTVNNTNPAGSLALSTNQTTMDINGFVDAIVYSNGSLTALDAADFSTNDITLYTSSLGSLSTADYSGGLTINTQENNFNLTTNVAEFTFNGNALDTLNLNSTLANNMKVNTNVDEIVLNTPTTSITVDGINLNNISGSANVITVDNMDNGVLNFDVDISSLQILDSDVISQLIITSDSLSTFNANNIDIGTLSYTNVNNNTTLSTTIEDIDVTSTGTGIVTINANSSNPVDIELTNVTEVNINALNTSTMTFSGSSTIPTLKLSSPSLTSVNTGSLDVTALEYTQAGSTTVDLTTLSNNIKLIGTETSILNLDANTLSALDVEVSNLDEVNINVPNATTINFGGSATSSKINIDSDSLTTINTNTFDIDTLSYYFVDNNTNITTISDVVVLNTTGSGNIGVTINSLSPTAVLSSLLVNDVVVTFSNSTDIVLSGIADNLEVIGNNISEVLTTSLTVNTNYVMNNTTIDDLEFVSTELLNSVNQIEMNTLDSINTGLIVGKLDGTSINLVSPIVEQDVYDFYYDTEVSELTAQEAIDNLKYDGFRSDDIDAAWAEILTNQYMDHLNEVATKAEIDEQTYQTTEQYFQNFLLDLGQTEEEYGVAASTTARNAITATLAEPVLTINEVDLQNRVTASIEAEATVNATDKQADDIFTLNN